MSTASWVVVVLYLAFGLLELVRSDLFHKPGQCRHDGVVEAVSTVVLLSVTQPLVIVAVSIRQIVSDEPYRDWVHLTAAISMFGCIVLVALYYAFYAAKKEQGRFAFAYGVIAALMAGFVAFIGARIFTHEGVDLFWAEVCVIVLFAAFWFVQTLDLWERDNKYRTGT